MESNSHHQGQPDEPPITSTTSLNNSQVNQILLAATRRQSQKSLFLGRRHKSVVRNQVNGYVIPAAPAREHLSTSTHHEGSYEKLRVCPQYNGQGCRVEPCGRLHICFHWGTDTCTVNSCRYDHSLQSPHNQSLLKAWSGHLDVTQLELSDIVNKEPAPKFNQAEPEICMFSISSKCTVESCSRVHYDKNYLWQVEDYYEWLELPSIQRDYLEMMYTHPSEELVDLSLLKTPQGSKANLRTAELFSKEETLIVDLEAMQLRGRSLMLKVRRLSTRSDLASSVPTATRWVWYWFNYDGCWEPYCEGVIEGKYCMALSDSLEILLQIRKEKTVAFSVGQHRYTLDGEMMMQTDLATGIRRSVRRRPACVSASRDSVKFQDSFLSLPIMKEFLKLPLMPQSSEFIFVESLLKQTLKEAKVASIHKVQNSYLWRKYQNMKSLLTIHHSDDAAINEQYLFHGTKPQVIDVICKENLNCMLFGTNVGHAYGCGSYFSSLASVAHKYTKYDIRGMRTMLVMMVLVGEVAQGRREMTHPPKNPATRKSYDTTSDSNTRPTTFVKYNSDECYPAYVVSYSCSAS